MDCTAVGDGRLQSSQLILVTPKSLPFTSRIPVNGSISGSGESEIASKVWKETMVEQPVTYTLLMGDKFFIIENVPARVCIETGERFFSPKTVERLQKTIWEQQQPQRMIETPVFDFAA